MSKILWIGAGLILLAWIVSTSWFTVDRAEFVYRTQFGRPVATYDGATDAGLHFKLPWPIQAVQRLDHRLQFFDVPEVELLTHDAKGKTIDKTLTIGVYVCWRIADKDGVDRFIRTVGSPREARDILEQRIKSRLGAAIGTMPIDDLISVAPEDESERRMEELRERLLKGGPQGDSLVQLAQRDYGIDLIDVRLRRFNHPASVREAIFTRIRSERQKKVADYESQGKKLADDILSKSKKEVKDIETRAKASEERLKREADIEADRIRNEAQSKAPEFYTFLQKLDAYQRILGDTKDLLLLSSRHELFDMLLKPPKPGSVPASPSGVANPMPRIVDPLPAGGNGGER